MALVLAASELLRADPTGCCLHIVLCDNNTEHGDVLWCLREALERGHSHCAGLADDLYAASRTQRRKVVALCRGSA